MEKCDGFYDSKNGIDVYVDYADIPPTVRIVLPSMVNISPLDAIEMGRALIVCAAEAMVNYSGVSPCRSSASTPDRS